MSNTTHPAIAVVGMAGRFPDASDVQAFWRNLEQGHESLRVFSDEELLASGAPPAYLELPQLVRKASIIDGSDLFDAAFFGINPREAEVLDPQHRLLLECAWQALEDAGYGGSGPKNVGVYAGASINTYVHGLFTNPEVLSNVGLYQVFISSDKDFLASRIGYKLDLRGPCVTVQTACSTSLVAVHIACRALIAHECDAALAGGVTLHFPQKLGYLYQEGMIFSPDGCCRPFDAEGRGIRNGEGAGLVVLKRLEDALRDRDCIRGVILGSAINNDGAAKIGYTAPSVDGQAQVLSAALAAAGVHPASVSYIEAHGTATPLGDAIEFAALSKVYGGSTVPCTLGAVKSNLGHLDIAAGVTGLIKTLLALEHQTIPPTLHFRQPNPQLPWENSRFHVNTEPQKWTAESSSRKAAVSSFGIGGTNAHVVLEEAPARQPSRVLWPEQLVVLSATTATALEAASQRMAAQLESTPPADLADACYTLKVGRTPFSHRRVLLGSSPAVLSEALRSAPARDSVAQGSEGHSVAFMFSGQGSQHHGMARDLYAFQPTFRDSLNLCAELLLPSLGRDIRELIYGSEPAPELNDTRFAQPVLFALEYALARMWMRFGVAPAGSIGHSLGEFAAACIAGVFSLEDALKTVAFRGQLMQSMPRGSMLSVALSESDLQPRMPGALTIAAVNSRSMCAVSGPEPDIAEFQKTLETRGIGCSRLHTSHAFHSRMMEPAVPQFRDFLRGIRLNRPATPFISNVTGTWISPDDAANPDYWARHVREKVQFSAGVRELAASSNVILLEVGPGTALTALARESTFADGAVEVLSSLPHPKDQRAAATSVLNTIGKLWLKGVPIDWEGVHEGEALGRIPLPTYPFERRRYFIAPAAPGAAAPDKAEHSSAPQKLDFEDWFHLPSWKRTISPEVAAGETSFGPWLVFADKGGLADAFLGVLSRRGDSFVRVDAGSAFSSSNDNAYVIDPNSPAHYQSVLSDLIRKRRAPRSILFCWSLGPEPESGTESFQQLIRLAQAFAEVGYSEPLDLVIVSAGMQKVRGDERVDPSLALLLGPCKTIPIEYPNIRCRIVDIERTHNPDQSAALLACEPAIPSGLQIAAYRGGYRWEQFFERIRLPQAPDRIRPRGVYLITGGMGGIGLSLARYLASFKARIALLGRTALPARDGWDSWVASHPEDDPVSLQIRNLLDLETLGAEVLHCCADVSNAGDMRRAVETVHARFGPIEGIVHAAGIAGGGLMQIKTADATAKVLAPKVTGTQVLRSLTAADPLDFFVLCSSVNAIGGMIGGVDYTAANAYLDAYATAENSNGPAVTMSINWDTWQDVGMAVNTPVPREMQAARLAALRNAIRPSEGVEVFKRVLAARLPQVLVLTQDVPRPASPAAHSVDAPPTVHPDTTAQAAANNGQVNPPASDDRELWENETARTIAKIWQDALGHARIGMDDNFFDLGGHSLAASSVLARARSAFDVNLPLRVIFESPTVRSLTQHIETLRWNVSGLPDGSEDTDDREEVEI